jgi:murein DD-endopeptidase MepM/ murein hydrolase activator NlpD
VLLGSVALSSCSDAIIRAPTPVLAGAGVPVRAAEAAISPSPVPLEFVLPTPRPEPLSGWRPPLYAVPWALSPNDHFYFTRPISADHVNWPLADYRYGGVFFAPDIVHTGVDIPAPAGTPIMAAGAGQVVWAGWGLFTEAPGNESDPYGLAVAVRHDFGFQDQSLFTVYAHMSQVDAIRGQHVEAGDALGLVGATGETTGPHLHFEVRLTENSFHATYNPELWIAPPQGWGVVVGRIEDSRGQLLQQVEVYVRSEASQEVRMVRTYGGQPVNADPFYRENMAIGDLPAGLYRVTLRFDDKLHQTWIEVYPGRITPLVFRGEAGFQVDDSAAGRAASVPTANSP